MFGRFFRLPKPKSFEFKPRYYDERKEALEYRIEQIKLEMGIEDDSPEAGKFTKEELQAIRIKGNIRSGFRKNRKAVRRSNFRLLLILLVLLLLTYFIIFV